MREIGGKVHSVRPLERHAFGGQWTDEKERLSHTLCLYFLTVGDRWKYLRITSNGKLTAGCLCHSIYHVVETVHFHVYRN